MRPAALFPLLLCATLHAVTLTGVQKDAEVVLAAGARHTLTETYTVPAGKRLVIEAGAALTAPKHAAIVVDGELAVKGTAAAPALLRGQGWKGIRIADTGVATIGGLQVTGAELALDVTGRVDKITDSVFAKNTRAVALKGDAPAEITNCLFQDNDDSALITGPARVSLKNCSFLRNKGYGVDAASGSPAFELCLFTDNGKGGVTQSNANGATGLTGVNCSFDGKGLGISLSLSHGSANFSGCHWGEKSTALLKSKGVDANLPNVRDARDGAGSIKVRQDGFLAAAPKGCGATVKSKL